MDIQSLKKEGQSFEAQRAVDWLDSIIGPAEDAIQLAWVSSYMDIEKFEADYGAQIFEAANGGNYGNVLFNNFYTKIHDAMDITFSLLGGQYLDHTPEKD